MMAPDLRKLKGRGLLERDSLRYAYRLATEQPEHRMERNYLARHHGGGNNAILAAPTTTPSLLVRS